MLSRRRVLVVAAVGVAFGSLVAINAQDPLDLRSLAREQRNSLRQLDRRLGRLEQLADRIARRTGRSGAEVLEMPPTPEDVVAAQLAYQRGRSEAVQQNHEAAIAAFTEAVTLDPNRDSAFLYRGLEHFQMGRLDLALADVNESLSIQPHNAQAYTFRARILRRLDETHRAAADLDESLSRDPTNAEALSLRAEIAIEAGDFQSALAGYERALQAQPASAELRLGRALVLRKADRLQEALADCNVAISVAPSLAEAYACRADVHLRQRRTALLLEDLDAVFRLDPDLPAATGLISSIKRLDELETLANAVAPAIRPGDNPAVSTPSLQQTEPHSELTQRPGVGPAAAQPRMPASSATPPMSQMELAKGRADGVEWRTAAVPGGAGLVPGGPGLVPGGPGLVPGGPSRSAEIRKPTETAGATNPPAEIARQQTAFGREHTARGRYQEAIEALSMAVKLDPASALAYNSRGYAYLRVRDLDNAIRDFTDAIQLNPAYANAWWNRAVARMLKGDEVGSDEDRRRADDLGWVNTGRSVISVNHR